MGRFWSRDFWLPLLPAPSCYGNEYSLTIFISRSPRFRLIRKAESLKTVGKEQKGAHFVQAREAGNSFSHISYHPSFSFCMHPHKIQIQRFCSNMMKQTCGSMCVSRNWRTIPRLKMDFARNVLGMTTKLKAFQKDTIEDFKGPLTKKNSWKIFSFDAILGFWCSNRLHVSQTVDTTKRQSDFLHIQRHQGLVLISHWWNIGESAGVIATSNLH